MIQGSMKFISTHIAVDSESTAVTIPPGTTHIMFIAGTASHGNHTYDPNHVHVSVDHSGDLLVLPTGQFLCIADFIPETIIGVEEFTEASFFTYNPLGITQFELSSPPGQQIGGGDVTPDPVNWPGGQAGLYSMGPEDGFFGNTTSAQINGISSPIILSVSYTIPGAPSPGGLWYKIDSVASPVNVYNPPDGMGYTEINSGGTISILNGQYISFMPRKDSVPVFSNVVVTVTNTSDANAVLDTFTISQDISALGGGGVAEE